VPVFVATLLPPHPFVIGAEPALTRAVCDALFGRVADARAAAQRAAAHEEARRGPLARPPPPPDVAAVAAAVRERMGEPAGLHWPLPSVTTTAPHPPASLDDRKARGAPTHSHSRGQPQQLGSVCGGLSSSPRPLQS
jgi:hypothetical protein